MGKVKTIGILTPDGDTPGMNTSIHSVTCAGIYNQYIIKDIYRGFDGRINGGGQEVTKENISGTITKGSTILKTTRSKEFTTLMSRQKANESC